MGGKESKSNGNRNWKETDQAYSDGDRPTYRRSRSQDGTSGRKGKNRRTNGSNRGGHSPAHEAGDWHESPPQNPSKAWETGSVEVCMYDTTSEPISYPEINGQSGSTIKQLMMPGVNVTGAGSRECNGFYAQTKSMHSKPTSWNDAEQVANGGRSWRELSGPIWYACKTSGCYIMFNKQYGKWQLRNSTGMPMYWQMPSQGSSSAPPTFRWKEIHGAKPCPSSHYTERYIFQTVPTGSAGEAQSMPTPPYKSHQRPPIPSLPNLRMESSRPLRRSRTFPVGGEPLAPPVMRRQGSQTRKSLRRSQTTSAGFPNPNFNRPGRYIDMPMNNGLGIGVQMI